MDPVLARPALSPSLCRRKPRGRRARRATTTTTYALLLSVMAMALFASTADLGVAVRDSIQAEADRTAGEILTGQMDGRAYERATLPTRVRPVEVLWPSRPLEENQTLTFEENQTLTIKVRFNHEVTAKDGVKFAFALGGAVYEAELFQKEETWDLCREPPDLVPNPTPSPSPGPSLLPADLAESCTVLEFHWVVSDLEYTGPITMPEAGRLIIEDEQDLIGRRDREPVYPVLPGREVPGPIVTLNPPPT